jgi:hypothetical protein
MEFELSELGTKAVAAENLDIEQLTMLPRTIDAMRIVLTKKP